MLVVFVLARIRAADVWRDNGLRKEERFFLRPQSKRPSVGSTLSFMCTSRHPVLTLHYVVWETE